MDLKIATEEDRKKWDTLVANSYGGTVFHTLKFLKCLETHTTAKILGRRYPGVLIPLVAREGAIIVALLPLFFYKGLGIRLVKSGSYNDDLIYLGPVFMESDRLKPAKLQVRTLHLQKELDNYLKNDLKAQIVAIRFSPFNTDARPFIWDGYDVEPAHSYVYNLENGTEAIWSGFNRGVRKVINNAQKSGITVEQGGVEDAEFVYDKLALRNRTNSSKAFVLDIVKLFSPDNCCVFIARLNEKRLSGVIVLHYGDYAYLWIGFPGIEGDTLGANELIMWEVIKWAHSKGYKTLENTGGDDITTYPFKRKFNPTLMQYFKAERSSFIFRSYKCIKQMIFVPRIDSDGYCGEDDGK